jgi:hypothetical protein
MKKRRKSTKRLKSNAFTSWSKLVVKTAAMMTASAEVIVARTQRLATAPLPLSTNDAREVHRMVAEKAEAAIESAQAITPHMINLLPDMLRVAASSGLSVLQARLNRKLQEGSVSMGNAAMTPFFKRARANARRRRNKP